MALMQSVKFCAFCDLWTWTNQRPQRTCLCLFTKERQRKKNKYKSGFEWPMMINRWNVFNISISFVLLNATENRLATSIHFARYFTNSCIEETKKKNEMKWNYFLWPLSCCSLFDVFTYTSGFWSLINPWKIVLLNRSVEQCSNIAANTKHTHCDYNKLISTLMLFHVLPWLSLFWFVFGVFAANMCQWWGGQ